MHEAAHSRKLNVMKYLVNNSANINDNAVELFPMVLCYIL
ncbi:hypothetical protein EJB10_01260 [Wolbachia endosymbiont of Brugia malayi]|nr:hypothetical protein EJB10_01260 [Wolbachia endosymbiont of Brugia malayi]